MTEVQPSLFLTHLADTLHPALEDQRKGVINGIKPNVTSEITGLSSALQLSTTAPTDISRRINKVKEDLPKLLIHVTPDERDAVNPKMQEIETQWERVNAVSQELGALVGERMRGELTLETSNAKLPYADTNIQSLKALRLLREQELERAYQGFSSKEPMEIFSLRNQVLRLRSRSEVDDFIKKIPSIPNYDQIWGKLSSWIQGRLEFLTALETEKNKLEMQYNENSSQLKSLVDALNQQVADMAQATQASSFKKAIPGTEHPQREGGVNLNTDRFLNMEQVGSGTSQSQFNNQGLKLVQIKFLKPIVLDVQPISNLSNFINN